ncbi:MAG: hypothetical protein BWY80_01070 [Firmicutes bacterium ADurb.Bin456]|nr:MAG: hypothetical protein BWY80_01070 [Firmicutes bacterium ADurb.Bin456]
MCAEQLPSHAFQQPTITVKQLRKGYFCTGSGYRTSSIIHLIRTPQIKKIRLIPSAFQNYDVSQSISRVLSWVIIYLGRLSLAASSDLTRERDGPPQCSSIRSCSGWGLPSRAVARPLVRSYRTVPSLPHPFRGMGGLHFCGTILGVAPTGYYPAPCPAEPGLSSDATFRPGARDHLICSLQIIQFEHRT